MRIRGLWLVGVFVAAAVGVAALSHGQEHATGPAPISSTPVQAKPRLLDLTKLTTLQRQIVLSAQRGSDWLQRANRPDGHFVPGYVPALRKPLEGDHYLRQAAAAFALARAAHFFADERAAAVARQAVLTLLLDTTTDDARNPQVRYTTLPSSMVNRLGAAGLLVLAINELPAPATDLLDQSDQLCNYIRRQQQADGSLVCTSEASDASPASIGAAGEIRGTTDAEGSHYFAGLALYGLTHSQSHRPAAWKTDVVRKAFACYQPGWRVHKSLAPVPWQTAAYTEAYLLTHEPALGDFVCEMSDWVCTLQYQQLDPRRPLWLGGFMGWADGKPQPLPPHVGSAAYGEGLAHACRVARQAGDLPRYQRYRDAIERCLQFLTTLQYTEANAQHFADWYRPNLLGAFHASHQDGDLRLDYTQHAVGALVDYLDYVAELP
jgi:hypothetical protein